MMGATGRSWLTGTGSSTSVPASATTAAGSSSRASTGSTLTGEHLVWLR